MPRKADTHRTRPARGVAFACPVHGDLGVNVIPLGGFAYCPREDCTLRADLVSRAPQATDLGMEFNAHPVVDG